MRAEPSYLPLLRRVADAERNAEVYLSAWAQATPRDDVRRVVATVALREGEHALAFRKRICELGFDVAVEQAPDTAGKVAIGAATDLTDREKFEQLGLGRRPDPTVPDRWANWFEDTTIDIATGELLGRFLAEERDSVRMFATCYEALCADEARTSEVDFRAGLRRDGLDDEIRITAYEPCRPAGELHTHPFDARLLVLEGEFTITYDDRTDTITAGQCCDVPSGTRHAEGSGTPGARVLAGLRHPR